MTLTKVFVRCVTAILVSVIVGMVMGIFHFSLLSMLFATSISSLVVAGIGIGLGDGTQATPEELSEMKEFIEEQERLQKESKKDSNSNE